MRKFLAVLKREYFKVVWTKVFILTTLLAPVGMLAISFLPVLMFSIKGNAVRLAIVEKDGKFYQRLNEYLSTDKQRERFKNASEDSLKNINQTQEEQLNQTAKQLGGTFALESFKSEGKTDEQIKAELNQRIAEEKIDAFLIVPDNIEDKNANFEFYARNSSDFVSKTTIENAVNDAIRLERLSKVNISEQKLKEINQKVKFNTKAVDKTGVARKGNDLGFPIAFGLGFLFYISITLYGSVVMGAVVEEKETKIAEILFSSANPFALMMGKIVGVCLAGLTQIAIWVTSALVLLAYLLVTLQASGNPIEIPNITPLFVFYFFVNFLLGFFLFSTIFALIGSMVTTTQEGGQFMIFIVIILMIGLYSVIPIVRDPNSTFSTIVSLVPFVSPITMTVRIFTETPPFWQILISFLLNVLTICGLVWVTARVYRVGMLMYGKRATIPEVWRWIRQR